MNQCGFYTSDLGRRLYQEIAMVEEQHVSQYGSLIDVKEGWLECWLNHEYTECYVYYSCWKDETDKNVKRYGNSACDKKSRICILRRSA